MIDRGAQLLTLVLEAETPRGLTQLAEDAGLPKSTASRLLGALERHGLVAQQGERGRFRPGPALVRFASRGAAGRNLVELADRPMDVPPFVANTKLYGSGPAYLGPAYAPYMPAPNPQSSSPDDSDPTPGASEPSCWTFPAKPAYGKGGVPGLVPHIEADDYSK